MLIDESDAIAAAVKAYETGLSSSFALFEALSDGGWRGIARKVSASKTTKLEYV